MLINAHIGVPPTEHWGVIVLRACVSYKGLKYAKIIESIT